MESIIFYYIGRMNMKRRERKRTKKNKIKKYTRNIIGGITLIILFYTFGGINKENSIRIQQETESKKEKVENSIEIEKLQKSIEIEETVFEKIEEEYKGYKVEAKLEVPKIGLETNVLKDYSAEGLKICASKYWGPEANEIGNFCIAGHNYEQENMFNHLIDLEIGDSVFLTDNQHGKVEYSVYDIYKVKPQNTEPLEQQTNGKREVTLITCTNYSKYRMIIKAREKEE